VTKVVDAFRREPTSEAQLAVMRATVRDGAADRPGIYRMLSSTGEVVYVGKSKQVRTRLLALLQDELENGADE